MTDPTGEVIADPDEYCYRHPDRVTGVHCTRCERPICPDCMQTASVGFQCPSCVAEGRKTVRQARTIYGGAIAAGRPDTVTMVLIGINVVMFVLTSTKGISFSGSDDSTSIFQHLSLVPPAIAHGQWYRIVTSMFLHLDLIHIAFNMYALYQIGPFLERRLGVGRYLAVYFLSGVGGSVLSLLNGPVATEAVGASGAIFGLFSAFYIVARRENFNPAPIVVTIALNLALSFGFASSIDWRGHVGGLIVGAIAMALLAYAPLSPRRVQLQVTGLAVIAVLLAGLSVVGIQHVKHECRSDVQTADASGSINLNNSTDVNAVFCAAYRVT